MTRAEFNDTPEQAARRISAVDKSDGAIEAFKVLKNEIHDFQMRNKNQTDISTFIASINQNLMKTNVLPDLAVVWAKENSDYSEDGNLSKRDVKLISQARDPLTSTMGGALLNNFDKIRAADAGSFGTQSDKITSDDLEAWLKAGDTKRRDEKTAKADHAALVKEMSPLVQNDGDLFKKVARTHADSDKDQSYITLDDLNKLKAYDEQRTKIEGKGLLTPEQRNCVNNEIKVWWDDKHQQLRSSHSNRPERLTIKQLAENLGTPAPKQSNTAPLKVVSTQPSVSGQGHKAIDPGQSDHIQVKAGEGYWQVAQRAFPGTHTTSEVLSEVNHLQSLNHNMALHPGTTLKIK